MSYGTFHTFIKPNIRYGISFGGRFVGMQMDIDRLLRAGVAKDNILQTLANFNQAQGPRQSANEHLVPEQLFDDPNTEEKEVEGVSAVKAIQLATQQGQALYTITKDNYAEILPKLNHDSETMSDIRNAINAGKVVTVHASAINHLRWHGTGYIITDTATGAGAYMISGGFNGGDIGIVENQKGMNLGVVVSLFIGFLENRQSLKVLLKTFGGTIGQLFTTVILGYKFFTNCSDTTNTLALTLIFSMISIAIAIALFFIFTPFVGFVLSMAIGILENKMADYFIKEGC